MSGTEKANSLLQIKMKAAFTQWKEQMHVIEDSSAEDGIVLSNVVTPTRKSLEFKHASQ